MLTLHITPATLPPSQLLAAPLTQQLIRNVAVGMEWTSLPLMAIAPSGTFWSFGAANILHGEARSCSLISSGFCMTFVCHLHRTDQLPNL